ncbi:hypothetical protein DS742_12920 [Lacrimispora amygdalina]|uniref:Uncharacterized protein n=1 Tax=Lacrimispora amygdalina TaxID=253257 RepID=A0A3E2NBY7_9FIRM|nr:hypothetical protein [Clostridium indicum]RFZ78502.1 hypothetical protein DS742_12920 [Clostridium indicum]
MTQANRYKELAALTKRADNLDPAYHAAFYLLSYDPELYETARRFVNVDGIGFTGIKRATRDFDERTRFVVDIAHNLFSYNSACKATPFEISRLGYPNLEMVCNSFYIATGDIRVVLEPRQDGQLEIKLDDSRYQQSRRVQRQFEQLQKAMFADMVQDEAIEPER